jgi:hypothetical protein
MDRSSIKENTLRDAILLSKSTRISREKHQEW